jgi:hypothetical protein
MRLGEYVGILKETVAVRLNLFILLVGLERGPLSLVSTTEELLVSFSMRSVSYQRKVGFSSYNILFFIHTPIFM